MDIKTWIYSSCNISTVLSGFCNGSSVTTTLYSGLVITLNSATSEICMGGLPQEEHQEIITPDNDESKPISGVVSILR